MKLSLCICIKANFDWVGCDSRIIDTNVCTDPSMTSVYRGDVSQKHAPRSWIRLVSRSSMYSADSTHPTISPVFAVWGGSTLLETLL